MIMKQLFRHTSTLLRSALLLGAMAFVNIQQTQGQTAAQLAEMPNAFETIENPNTIIGNGQYYYIQFYHDDKISYLTDCGLSKKAGTKDFLPSNNRLWTMERVGDSNQFKLKSKTGYYIGLAKFEGASGNRYGSVASADDAVTFEFQSNSTYGYSILDTQNHYYKDGEDRGLGLLGRYNNQEWNTDLSILQNDNTGKGNSQMHIAQLKSNVAYIIYYRQEEKNEPVDAKQGNTNPNAETTRHYLTYSNTGNETDARSNYDSWLWKDSKVSSRKSIIPKDKLLRTLPTLAAYHQDGLWALEDAGNGEFYIKKYGTEEYLNGVNVGFYISNLGTKDETYGKYSFEDANANRYTRVMIKDVATSSLAVGQFYQWNYKTSDPTASTQNGSANAESHYNESLGSNGLVIGWGNVQYNVYADLTGCTKMVIEGTPGLQLRVLLNRLEVGNGGGDGNGGAIIERNPVIGDDGKAELDLTDLPYVHLNAIKTGWSSSGTVSSITLVRPDNSSSRHLNSAHGDGWYALQWGADDGDDWYAGFYPVEVPVPNKDEFYQVLVKWGGNMMAHDGMPHALPANEADYDLWQLEMVDDYEHFRLKAPDGRYLKPSGTGMTPANDPTDAEIMTNEKFWTDFSLTWFYVNPAQKEFPVNYMVTHRESYLKQYAEQYASMKLDRQGLATGAQSDWWNYEKQIQKVNHFEITHYLKEGNSMVVEFPTVLNKSNNHVYYQRFYNYDEDENSMDLDNLKAHVSLDTRDDGNVQYYLYRNGIVTGQKLNWDGKDAGGMARNALRRFNFTNSDGRPFTVAVDVSRYSDLTYKGATPETGDLEEPSLTMRYIYYMKDAKEMAKNLTACTEGSGKWLETKTFHFPMKQIFYENQKKVGYRGEFIGLRHVFSDYWVFNDGNPNSTDNNNLVSAVIDNTQGRIEVVIDDKNGTGIRRGGYNPNIDLKGMTEGVDDDYQGFYFYDKMSDQNKTQYGDSRFVVFRYPSSGEVAQTGADHPAYVNVYLNNNGTRYQLAQFTIIFDPGTVTLPYTSVNGSKYVKDDGSNHQYTNRDPKKLVEKAGKPIAKITFDYPFGDKYHFPSSGVSIQGWERAAGSTVDGSSPVPLTFDKTNYSFSAFECNWGSYAMVTNMTTNYGNHKEVLPANDNDKGYGDASVQALQADPGLQKAFLYIDASEQPGDICSAPFIGDFCSNDKLLFSGWISSSNKMGGSDNRCPGGITLTVKGEHNVHNADGTIKYDEKGNPVKETVTLYRFCPGQIYELDNGGGVDGSGDGSTHVVWQQFYFEFTVTDKYDRHWIEVNNNCVSSQGGDFMLDNIAVYAIVPEVIPGVNTPVCVDKKGNTEMRLLKLSVDFNKQISSANVTRDKAELGFVFLEKDLFLKTFRTELKNLTDAEKAELHLEAFNFSTISLDALADAIEDGEFKAITGENDGKTGNNAYRTAFDAAILGDKKTYYTKNAFTAADKNASIIYFEYNSDFNAMEKYSFAKAVNKTHAVYREEVDGEKFIVMNGNYPEMKWKANTDYYILISNNPITTSGEPFSVFNLCSECNKASVFHLDPPYTILGMESSDETQEYEVCEGKIPTVLTDLKGYNLNGEVVPLKNINFDWWLGDMSDPSNPVLATLENYHKQGKTINGESVKLDDALYSLRAYYPDISSLDGVFKNLSKSPELSVNEVLYLQELVEKGQLILHQRSVNIPAQKVSADDPYCYFVACPIHDGYFDEALNNGGANNVAYFCDEPQGLALKIGEKAPTLKTGFVPNENGFAEYHYPDGNPVLSIRLAKKEQFETVQHGTTADAAIANPATCEPSKHFLWLPIRNAEVQSTGSTQVIQKSDDYNVYLASTDDPVWDRTIYTEMSKAVSSLPIVGKIVQLNAVNTKGKPTADQTSNRLCIYFTSNFEVREGYSYTLSLPFRESPGENTCDGTILINLKIVPDYEVWTGAADNTDWNNDQNWRRADGNLSASTDEPTAQSPLNSNELYRTGDLPTTSPLYDYVTNTANYRTPLDRILRKGFAPLYCTHILIKSNEWGNAPVLYDALDAESGNANLTASPFPNLRDTSTPILKFDMQARHYELWKDTYGTLPNYNGTTEGPYKGRTGDLIAEMYQINSCDEIAFQPGAELLNAHLLNYNNAWVEYELNNNRWYLLGSPLQGTISGEWYAPSGTAQQKTTYYENVTFGAGYDRYSPAVFQRSWDKAKAVLYEVGSAYSTGDNPNDEDLGNSNTMPGSAQQGQWSGTTWDNTGADEYLDRLGYKPMDGKKANVAIKGVWSNTYNDATVDYTKGGFSVLVKNDLKGNDTSGGKSIIRLPKEDTMYDYYKFEESGANDGGTDTNLSDVRTLNRAKNRGRLKTDLLLPASAQKTESAASRYGDQRTYTRVPTQLNADTGLPIDGKLQSITETVAAGISNMGYYLVENPFPCGLDMGKFFAANTGLEKKYWLLTTAESGQSPRQQLVQQAPNREWVTADGNGFAAASAIVAPGQGFFVQATTAGPVASVTFNKDMQAQTRYGAKTGTRTFSIVVGTKQKMTTKEETITLEDGTTKTVTIEVPVTDDSGNYVVEDITDNVKVSTYVQSTGDGKEFPLKTRGTANNLAGLVITAERGGMQSSALVLQRGEASNDFLPEEDTEVFLNSDLVNAPTVYTLCGRLATTINTIHDFSCLPLGVESSSDAPCTLTFQGVEMLADSVALYDAVEQKLTPLESGMTVKVSGQTQNRYYLLGGMPTAIEAAEATHLQIFTEGRTATVIASTTEPLLNVRCYDMAGQLVYSASPQSAEHSFSLPIAGVYIIDAQTEHDRKTMKVVVR